MRNLALSLACVLVGAVIGFAIWKVKGGALTDPLVPAVMIAGTALGLALSFVPKVRNVKENSAAGHYLILVFSFALASSLDLGTLGGNLLHTVALLAAIFTQLGDSLAMIVVLRACGKSGGSEAE